MKYALVLLILFAACTRNKSQPPSPPQPALGGEVRVKNEPSPTSNPGSKKGLKLDSSKTIDKETQKILRWFEQMDAIYRESLWVLRKKKAPQGKSLFGKMQRALLIEMNQKLSNKSLFKCDVYSMKRVVMGVGGIPQKAEVFHRCHSKENFVSIGEWSHPTANELLIHFQGGNLSEVLGLATGILSPRIHCKLRSNDNGIIEVFKCENLMVDYHPSKNQVLRFSKFEYTRSAESLLSLKAEVLENLDPVRKIEVDVPLEGKIKVVETVLQAPMFEAIKVPTAGPVAKPPVSPRTGRPPPVPTLETKTPSQTQEAPDYEQNQNEQNQHEQSEQKNDPSEGPPAPEIPRELNTR